MNPGFGAPVHPSQTYLDISQGTRVLDDSYDRPLPKLSVDGGRVPKRRWRKQTRRAESAPIAVIPGLLAGALDAYHIPVRAERGINRPALIAVDERGRVRRMQNDQCPPRCPVGLNLVRATHRELRDLVRLQRGRDMLIAIREPPAASGHQLPIGIAGRGFDGGLTSDSTRTSGFVISTDIAPTVLERFGVDVPEEIVGNPIRTEGAVELGPLRDLDRRISAPPQLGTVVGAPILLWLLAAVFAGLASFRRAGRPAAAMFALSVVYLPTMLLVGAAIQPTEAVEALIAGIGSPLAAGLTLAVVRGYAAMAVACAITVGFYAVDVVAGAGLTPLSVLGPNPAAGLRFYGIGTELEAAFATMVPIGVGAWLGSKSDRSPRFAAAAFIAAALLATVAFAPGRFGADAGAAIVFPVGAAVAAAMTLQLSRRAMVIIFAVLPVGALLLLVVASAVLDANLTQEIFGADTPGELGDDIAERLRETGKGFVDPVYPALLLVSTLLVVLGIRFRRTIAGWFGDRLAAEAGFVGALAATAVGAITNESGASLFIVRTIVCTAAVGFFWARSPRVGDPPTGRDGKP